MYYLTHSEIHTISKGISPKVKVLAELEFALANYDLTVQHFSKQALSDSPYLFFPCSVSHLKLRLLHRDQFSHFEVLVSSG